MLDVMKISYDTRQPQILRLRNRWSSFACPRKMYDFHIAHSNLGLTSLSSPPTPLTASVMSSLSCL